MMTPPPDQSPNMPREQKNTMTSWIDGSFVYSTKVKIITTVQSCPDITILDPCLGLGLGCYGYGYGECPYITNYNSFVSMIFACCTIHQFYQQESWVNAMRSFENGTLKMEGSQEKGMPPLNSMRVPMENAPAPHLLTQLNPERMYLLGDPRYLLWESVLSDDSKHR